MGGLCRRRFLVGHTRAPVPLSHVASFGVVYHFGGHPLVLELCARKVDSDYTQERASFLSSSRDFLLIETVVGLDCEKVQIARWSPFICH